VNLQEYGPCRKENNYGYPDASPCVFLKIKKLKDWVPQVLNNSNSLPSDMPDHLKHYISNDRHRDQRAVWLSCDGVHPADVENIGAISYYPSYGFPVFFFPSKGDASYLEPLIAVRFEKPERECETDRINDHNLLIISPF
jgi:sodium/potassium-transporting ATPase subunit beta